MLSFCQNCQRRADYNQHAGKITKERSYRLKLCFKPNFVWRKIIFVSTFLGPKNVNVFFLVSNKDHRVFNCFKLFFRLLYGQMISAS